jgi:hypothetical protein
LWFKASRGKTVHEILSQKNPITKKGWWAAQGVLSSNPVPQKKKKEKRKKHFI